MNTKTKYYSLSEAVKILECNYKTAWYAVVMGKIDCLKIGPHPALTDKDIENLRAYLNRKNVNE